MPTRNELEKRRIAESEKAQKATNAVVRSLQLVAYGLVTDWLIESLETENGKIKYTASNLAKVAGLFNVLKRFQRQYKTTMLGTVLDWAGRLFGLNNDYFDTFSNPTESVADTARRLTLQRWGYNVNTGSLIPGGYFESLFTNANVGQRVAGLVNQAITQKMSLAQFQKTFRQVFVGQVGQGMLEKHWRTNSFDLYMRLDRTANLIYADRLGLNYAVYSGTLEEDSRPKCIASVNKVFSRPEIDKWRYENFQGKPKYGYDPFVDCAGYNCRHSWSWISDEIAAHLRPELKENANT